MRAVALFVASAVLAACAAYNPVPEGYIGPVAQLLDTGALDGATQVRLFVAEQIDGHRIDNSLEATRSASQGGGIFVTMQLVERQVPTRPMKVKLRASHIAGESGAAVLLLLLSGNFRWVEGVVDFVPEAGKTYIVNGVLDKAGSSVWIEEVSSGEPVTNKVLSK